jgi:hypothetical protein
MSHQSGRATYLWMFIPAISEKRVAEMTCLYRDIHVGLSSESWASRIANAVEFSALAIGDKGGSYQGPIGGRSLLSQYSGMSDDAIAAKLRRRYPRWTATKIERALGDIIANEQYNSWPDHLKQEYKRLWSFLKDVVKLAGPGVLIYDDGRSELEHIKNNAEFGLTHSEQIDCLNLTSGNSLDLHSVRPNKCYAVRFG